MTEEQEHESGLSDIEVATELLRDELMRTITMVTEAFDKRITIMERSVEAIEKQIATLSVGFGEQAVLIESLVGQLSYSSDEEREAFHETLKEKREQMFKFMQESTDAIYGPDSEASAAVEDLAKKP